MNLRTSPDHRRKGWSIDESDSWKQLKAHYQQTKPLRLESLFQQDSTRFSRFSVPFEGHIFDFSKNHITDETLVLFKELCQQANLFERMEALFKGNLINETEQRSALHCALRSQDSNPIYVDGENIIPLINDMQSRIESYSERIRRGRWLGSTGKPVRDVVNIGVGGSDLGPRMVTEAFKYEKTPGTNLHFVSSIDGNEIIEILQKLDPETSLFIISSKSFTTSDTLTNAQTVKSWLERGLGSVFDMSAHFIGVSENTDAMTDFGIPGDNQLPMWKWVGGRYSVWSAIGLPIAIALGMDRFREFLAGAQWADHHYRTAPLEKNIPIILAMLGIWFNSIGNDETHAVLPYDHRLKSLPDYLQQLEMESNGKSARLNNSRVTYPTCPIIWGEYGPNAQHAFYQLLHQGTRRVSVDFIAVVSNKHVPRIHQDLSRANCLAQARALMVGQKEEEAVVEGMSGHREYPGNKPSNTFLLSELTPRALGMIIAFYEHKVFTQSVIWNINPFDQWGVELGKTLAREILRNEKSKELDQLYDSSTCGLLEHCRRALADSE